MDLILTNFFELNNRIIGSITVFELLKRKNDIIIPYTQRMSDDNKIKEIVDYQMEYKRRHNRYNFLGLLNLNYCIKNGKYYLVDGQHRFNAIQKLVENYEDFKVGIEIVMIENQEDLIENYNLINKNTPLPELSDTLDKFTHKLVFQHFEKKYEKIWTTSNRPKRPYMNKNHFQEALGYMIEKLSIDDHNQIIRIIEDHNQRISHWNPDRIGNMKQLKDPFRTIDICRNIGCFLGLFVHSTEEYHYKWVLDIIHMETGEEIKHKKKKQKRAIPKIVKQNVWNTYVGNQIGSTKCLVCGETEILQSLFHAGHVISEFNGGRINVDNLRPICSLCNTCMGTRNMGDFVEEFFPENLEKLGLANL